MAHYLIQMVVEGKRLDTIRKQAEKAFGAEAAAQVDKIDDPTSRADRLSDIQDTIETAVADIDSLREEMQEWYDSIPENLQNGDKAQEVQAAIEALETLKDELELVEFGNVDFPSMM